MRVGHERGGGLDVHKRTVVAGVRRTPGDGRLERWGRTFGTMPADRRARGDGLDRFGVTPVALERTGVSWRPVVTSLEAGRELVLVTPWHLTPVPGRTTDVTDAEWLADRLRHGLLRASGLPPAPIRGLRELTRSRTTLVQARPDEVHRLQQALAGATLKRAAVVSEGLGRSSRARRAALLGGEPDSEVLAEVARGRRRAKLPSLRRARDGRVTPHHLGLLGHLLAHLDFLEERIAQGQEEIEQGQAPFRQAVALLQTIPGGGEVVATALVAELGTDVRRVPSAKPLASWGGAVRGTRRAAAHA